MGWFSRRKQVEEQPVIEPAPCRHKWKDFKWYIDIKFDNSYTKYSYGIYIYEPYVCVHCKERKDVKLSVQWFPSKEKAREYLEEIVKRYEGYLEDKPIIEDAIHDMQLVDREYLDAYERLIQMRNNPLVKIET